MSKKFFRALMLVICLTLVAPFFNTTKAFAATEPQIIGASAITMDMDTGEIIYSKNADVQRSPASTTKLLTSLLFAENKNKSDIISYSDVSAAVTETALTNFIGNTAKAGDTLTADEVMNAVMVYSANDAAVMMAESVAGSVDAFSELMNEKAKEIGAVNSHFVSPNGLETDPNNHNVTTAYDLALIASAAYQNDWVREASGLAKTSVTLDGKKIYIETRDKILGVDGNIGGKTGNETKAGHCFVGFYNRNGRNLVTVVLGSEYGADGMNVFNDTEAIANYSYDAEKTTYKSAGDEISTVDLSYKLFKFFGPTKTITAPVVLNQDIEYYKNDFNDTNATLEVPSNELNAWKVASNNNVDLVFTAGKYSETVKGSITLKVGQILKANIGVYVLALLITVLIIVLIFVIIKLMINSKRRRRNRRSRYSRY
ncbi:D-alanyl-D-alanine carboxypeptidase family protein [Clostridium sp. D43t1_170807_H7]|uniref:D-alanyl-D-alanine carboxypeptidase family protein n=1 Tax=Clostridium sp. D43t1_170807_H7 TaxID=2787140 RepID=UPI00189B0B8C|nr:D-alanyl-D-alanine carboxypeptidase family protein [Clostridium sp. D43t1_170807_H7]